MPEAIPVIIIAVFMLASGYAGYRAGAEKAQREAFYTISTLRHSLAKTRLEVSRLQELLSRSRHPTAAPKAEVPKWMQ